jgi:hypothetical protein
LRILKQKVQVREGLEFADLHFVDDLIVYRGNAPPWYASSVAYWVLSVLLLSWPLRIFSDWRTAYIDYQVTKLFGTNYLRLWSPRFESRVNNYRQRSHESEINPLLLVENGG